MLGAILGGTWITHLENGINQDISDVCLSLNQNLLIKCKIIQTKALQKTNPLIARTLSGSLI